MDSTPGTGTKIEELRGEFVSLEAISCICLTWNIQKVDIQHDKEDCRIENLPKIVGRCRILLALRTFRKKNQVYYKTTPFNKCTLNETLSKENEIKKTCQLEVINFNLTKTSIQLQKVKPKKGCQSRFSWKLRKLQQSLYRKTEFMAHFSWQHCEENLNLYGFTGSFTTCATKLFCQLPIVQNLNLPVLSTFHWTKTYWAKQYSFRLHQRGSSHRWASECLPLKRRCEFESRPSYLSDKTTRSFLRRALCYLELKTLQYVFDPWINFVFHGRNRSERGRHDQNLGRSGVLCRSRLRSLAFGYSDCRRTCLAPKLYGSSSHCFGSFSRHLHEGRHQDGSRQGCLFLEPRMVGLLRRFVQVGLCQWRDSRVLLGAHEEHWRLFKFIAPLEGCSNQVDGHNSWLDERAQVGRWHN